MAQINEDLETLKTARDNMKIALENKGQIVNNDIRTYASAITNIPSGSGSGDVKLFDTVEHMQADPDAHEGDLAIVYEEKLQFVTEDSEFDRCIFPNTVVLDEAFVDDIYCSFIPVEGSSGWFDGMVEMSSSGFRFDGYGDIGEIRVEYESQDGITYTRTDGGDELQEFGTTIMWGNYGEPFNSVVGRFMKINISYFNAMYKSKYVSHSNILRSNVFITTTGKLYKLPTKFNFMKERAYAISISSSHIVDSVRSIYEIDTCDIYEMNTVSVANMFIIVNIIGGERKQYIGGDFSDSLSFVSITKYTCNFSNTDPIVSSIVYQYGNSQTSNLTNFVTSNTEQKVISQEVTELIVFCITSNNKMSPQLLDYHTPYYELITDTEIFPSTSDAVYTELSNDTTTKFPNVLEYCVNPAQLDATVDYVYGKYFLRKK